MKESNLLSHEKVCTGTRFKGEGHSKKLNFFSVITNKKYSPKFQHSMYLIGDLNRHIDQRIDQCVGPFVGRHSTDMSMD